MKIDCKVIFVWIFFVSITYGALGQKVKYKDYKNTISIENYQEIIKNPKYSPLVAGVANFMLPPVGYFYVGEPLRGLAVGGGQILTGGFIFYGTVVLLSENFMPSQHSDKNLIKRATMMFVAGIILHETIHIWSIFDVVKIAKVKNLAIQYNKDKVRIKLNPDINFCSVNYKNNLPVYGLKLGIIF